MSLPNEIKKLDLNYYNSLVFTAELNCPNCNTDYGKSHPIQQGEVEYSHQIDGDIMMRFKEIRHCNSCHQDYSTTDGY